MADTSQLAPAASSTRAPARPPRVKAPLEPMAPRPAREAKSAPVAGLGAQLVAQATWEQTLDLSRLVRGVVAQLTNRGRSPIERSVLVAEVLAALEPSARGACAVAVATSLPPGALSTLGRAGLLELRAACREAGEEYGSAAVRTLGEALGALGELQLLEVGGVTVALEGVGRASAADRARRLVEAGAAPLDREDGFVVAVGRQEAGTERELVLRCLARALADHPSFAGEALARARRRGTCLVVDEGRLPTRSVGPWTGLRAALGRLTGWARLVGAAPQTAPGRAL